METTEENKSVSVVEPKSNLLVAILCSILFGLVGAVVYGLLYYVGYIAWVGAYAVVMLAGFGYKKFYGKIDKKGYVFVAIISIVEVFLSMFVVLGIVISAEYNVSFGTAVGAIFEVMGNADVKAAFISDAIFSVVFIIAGLVTYIFIEKRNNQQANVADTNATTENVDMQTTSQNNSSSEEAVASSEEVNTEAGQNETDVNDDKNTEV